jgi:4-alpha-glucanotransferase
MKQDGYKWWLKRIENALSIYDVVRIDHFRGLYSYWAVPFANKTAKKGEWLKGPGMDLIRKIRTRYPDKHLIMEDLGSLDRNVKRFFESTGYPGMRVMQFGFGADGDAAHLTKNYPAECVAYTGTHDNNTILGWYDDVSELTKADSLIKLGFPSAHPEDPITDREICRAWIENLFASEANLVIVPIQDLLCEGMEARMNYPGTNSPSNWTYRVDERKLKSILDADWISELNAKYGRSPQTKKSGADKKSGNATAKKNNAPLNAAQDSAPKKRGAKTQDKRDT